MVAAVIRNPSPELRVVPSARAVIYCRVSDAGATDAYGMDTQEAECRAYAATQGWEVVAVYHEWFTGASLFGRPELGQLRASVRRGELDTVLVHRVDRLSRTAHHVGFIRTEFEAACVTLASATEDLSNPIVTGVMGGIAEADRKKIITNTNRGRRAKLAAGKHPGTGAAPYGMIWELKQLKTKLVKVGLIEDPTTAPVVRRIFAEAAAGLSIRGIADGLTDDGVAPPRATTPRWGRATVRHILRSPAYAGVGVWNASIVTTDANGKRTRTRRPEAERVRLPDGLYPQIVDTALYAAAQDRLDGNKRESPAYRDTRNPDVGLLRRGLAVCGVCGGALGVKVKGKGGPAYRCERDRRLPDRCAGNPWITVHELDAAAWDYLTNVLSHPERIRGHIERLRADDPTAPDLAGLDRQQREIERAQANLTAAITHLSGNPEALGPLIRQADTLGKQLAAIERDRAAVLARQATWRAEVDQLADLEIRCQVVREQIALATEYADRRDLLRSLKVQASLFPAGLPERWVITSGVVADVATNLANPRHRLARADP